MRHPFINTNFLRHSFSTPVSHLILQFHTVMGSGLKDAGILGSFVIHLVIPVIQFPGRVRSMVAVCMSSNITSATCDL